MFRPGDFARANTGLELRRRHEKIPYRARHGLVKKTAHSYTYYLTSFGREVVAAGLRLKEFVILDEFKKQAA